MKKPLYTALIILIAILLLLSESGVRSMTLPLLTKASGAQEHDTTGLLTFIRTEPFNLEIIPPASGVQYYENGIIFLSNTKYEGKMLPKHVSFGSIEAYTAIVRDTSLGLHILFSPSESFSFPCEATTFTSDYKTMYFTKIGKKERKEKIFRATYTSGNKGNPAWKSDEKPLEFCNGDYVYTHPAITADGNTMVFASDMQGSNGGLDLFVTRKEGDLWSAPQNIGKGVNTPKDECFPFIDKDNNLFFSSDGLAGYGGYDIFTSKFNGTGWDRPVNLSKKINSENDDIAFSIDRSSGDNAFYTTRKKSGKNDIQLIRVTLRQDLTSAVPLTISYIFNGKPRSAVELVAEKPVEEVKPLLQETTKTASQEPAKPKQTSPPKPQQKDVTKESKTVSTTPSVTAPKTQDAKVVIIRNTSELPSNLKDKVIYRVQFLSTGKQRKETTIDISGTSYKTFEYFYLDLYRYTVGEFTTLGPAKELQDIVRKAGYPGAFVAAFKNEMRSLDLSLFK